MSQRIVVGFERGLTATVNDVEHIESQSLNGLGVVKIFFYPNVRIDMAMAQVTAIAQSAVRQDPPGTIPPFILAYNASSVPILQLALSGKGLSEQQLNDLAGERPAHATRDSAGRRFAKSVRRKAARKSRWT